MIRDTTVGDTWELCRGVKLPGVYRVALGDGRMARFVDNRYAGTTDVESAVDAAVAPHGTGDAWILADGWPPVPPWSDLAPDLYRDVEELAVDSIEVLGITTASPFGEARIHSRYKRGRPTRRLVNELEGAELVQRCEVVIRRRLSCVLLYRAGEVDLLGSLRGGEVSGDWTRLMLLAGLAEGPSVVAAHATAQRAQLIALALFSEAWSHRVSDAIT